MLSACLLGLPSTHDRAAGNALLVTGDALLVAGDPLQVTAVTGMGLPRSGHAPCVHQQAVARHVGGATVVPPRTAAVGYSADQC